MTEFEKPPARLRRARGEGGISKVQEINHTDFPQLTQVLAAPLAFQSSLRAIAAKIESGNIGEARALATALGLSLGTVRRGDRIQPTTLRMVTA